MFQRLNKCLRERSHDHQVVVGDHVTEEAFLLNDRQLIPHRVDNNASKERDGVPQQTIDHQATDLNYEYLSVIIASGGFHGELPRNAESIRDSQ